ncbi:hypothetical protein FNV43_RR06652 [Rhamnella rubrinervis]|uniref:Pentatricopeptide repeat-containing protein n=1 Tax=Rhamnella rubrinervis TaxID=2594499 RepID=A0A8K0MLZ6_9ROSA|nr:hypothetical protein FNV43_RR06652 [Rhamnella rubrinervis]
MISRLVSSNQFRSAEALFNRMKEEKCTITEGIFLPICRAYGRVHRPLAAIRVFRKMEDFQFTPTQKSYITIFAILVEEDQLKLAFSGTMDAAPRMFHEMANRWFNPDSYTYGTLIYGLCKLGRVGEAKELFKEMESKACMPSVVTYTNMIHGLCLCNNLDEAMGLFEEMKSKGISSNV